MKTLLTVLGLIVAVLLATGLGLYLYLAPEVPDPRTAEPGSTRSTTSGAIIGAQSSSDVYVWMGIPFAEPPVGELRWRAPRPKTPWTGTREALQPGSPCVQKGPGASESGFSGNEDCLYLNIWAPAQSASDDTRHPVMFWIHGGGNSVGEGATSVFDGTRYASEHGVVLVSINYRLGVFGWLSHPGLAAGDASLADASGNYGTLDAIAALTWVRDNIENFGGDAGNVTIFGESAGAFDVLALMASPLADGLFHRAISQSGGLSLASRAAAENYSDAEQPGQRFSSRELANLLLVASGRADSPGAARALQDSMSDAELVQWLRSLSAEVIYGLFGSGFGGMIGTPALIADGHVLPAGVSTREIFSDADGYNAVPVILGTNRDETKLFMMMSDDYIDKTFGLPSNIRDLDGYNRDTGYGSDLWKANGVDELADAMRAAQGESVYAYRFDLDDWRDLGFLDFGELLGAAHALELPFVFGNFPKPLRVIFADGNREELHTVSDSMMSYWAEFAHTGDPGRGRDGQQPNWSGWSAGSAPTLMVFDSATDGGIRMTSERVSTAATRTRFLADPSYPSLDAHCEALELLFARSGGVEEGRVALGCPDPS